MVFCCGTVSSRIVSSLAASMLVIAACGPANAPAPQTSAPAGTSAPGSATAPASGAKQTAAPQIQRQMVTEILRALFVGFAIKIPMFPFHTWLPDAHVEAPTAISVILAGVLLKMGTYGILRINFGILPEATAWAAPAMAALRTA